MDSEESKSFYIILLTIFSVVTSVMAVILMIQNKELKRQISIFRSALPTLQVGDKLTPFESKNIRDEWVQISYGDSQKKKLFFIMSSSYGLCNKMIPIWGELNSKVNKEKYEVIGIIIDDIDKAKEYAKAIENEFEVITFPNLRVQANYKIFSTPMTIIVNSTGEVEKILSGEIYGASIKELKRTIWK